MQTEERIDKWFSFGEPYCHLLQSTVAEAFNMSLKLQNINRKFSVCRLRGEKMLTANALFDECAAALQFPDYFGENWNAFDECINDLDWLPSSGYILMIDNADKILRNADDKEFALFLFLLHETALEWKLQKKPFNFILQIDADIQAMLEFKLNNLDKEILNGAVIEYDKITILQ